ncbi:MAG: hypothetical protein VB075_09645 [Petrimonas sp.]|uniref:hypothetical protein n=1 Tax=Petrimonas sp. TaxID=2023866 RepID=UPI002B3AE241|nr:hypothetical protein [Petrimonas sp.]MEA5044814.1 hypothetical protein [Petrimonas sp.]
METLGVDNDIQDCKSLIDGVVNVVGKFKEYASTFGIDSRLIASIQSNLNYP